jgi:hypothetical protein
MQLSQQMSFSCFLSFLCTSNRIIDNYSAKIYCVNTDRALAITATIAEHVSSAWFGSVVLVEALANSPPLFFVHHDRHCSGRSGQEGIGVNIG